LQKDNRNLVKELPRLAEDISIIIIRQKNTVTQANFDFKVRKHRILIWLKWLQKNSKLPDYNNMIISEGNLDKLPDDDFFQGIPTIEIDSIPIVVDTNRNHIEEDVPTVNSEEPFTEYTGVPSPIEKTILEQEALIAEVTAIIGIANFLKL
jgi:hypothetical protein